MRLVGRPRARGSTAPAAAPTKRAGPTPAPAPRGRRRPPPASARAAPPPARSQRRPSAGRDQVGAQRGRHERVASLACQPRPAGVVLREAQQRAQAHRGRRHARGLPRASPRPRSSRTSRSTSSAARRDQLAHLLGGLAEAAEHVRGDDLRVGRVGAPDAHAHPPEVRAAQLAAERLQPVVTSQTAAQARAHLAEGEVDLVVHRHHALQRQTVGAACRARPSGRPRS